MHPRACIEPKPCGGQNAGPAGEEQENDRKGELIMACLICAR